MPLLILPEDVLLKVLAVTDRPDAARMMRTSHFLYHEGSKIILRKPIHISSGKELSLFMEFLHAEGTRRPQFVRSLDVSVPDANASEHCPRFGAALAGMSNLRSLSIAVHSCEQLVGLLTLLRFNAQTEGSRLYEVLRSLTLAVRISRLNPETLQGLAAALPRMTQLQTLSVPTDGDMLYKWHPELAAAFVRMPSIRFLNLSNCMFDMGLRVLKTFQSPLVCVRIHFLSILSEPLFVTISDATLLELHPAELLSQSQGTLEELQTYGWQTHRVVPPNPSFVYPKMRRLDLQRTGLPLTMAYMRAYPNISHLRYCTFEGEMHLHDGAAIQLYDARHRFNVAAQAASSFTWSHLEEFRGNLVDLYMLGLNCTIDRLFLRFGPDGLCYQVEPVLSPTRPRHLEFSQGWPGDLSGPAGRVFDVFRGAGGSRLESLHCRIGLGRKHGDVDFSAVMEGLRASLSCTPLQELKATISLENLDTQPRAGALLKLSRLQVGLRATPPPPDPADCPLCPAEHSAAAFDLRAWMCDLIKAIVTIHKAEVILEGPRGRWRRTSFASGQVQYEEKA